MVKPAFGSSAYGVEIVEKGKIPAKISRNTIVQEMIDASKGVPGITRGVADLRVTIINGKIMHPYVRKAAKGSLFSNVSRGAKMIFAKKIPKSALEISKKIDKRLSKFKNRIYTIDIMFDQNSKPWVIELNSKPGFVGHYQFKGSKAVDAAYHEIFKGLTAKKRSRKP